MHWKAPDTIRKNMGELEIHRKQAGKEQEKVWKQIKFEQKLENVLNETNLDQNGEIQLEEKTWEKLGSMRNKIGRKTNWDAKETKLGKRNQQIQ